MAISAVSVADKADVLGRSTFAALQSLGFRRDDVSEIIGRNRSSVVRNGINPGSKEGEMALLMIRIYRSLYALMGGDSENMQHFMRTANSGTGGVPAEQIRSVSGLVTVCEYLDAMRARG